MTKKQFLFLLEMLMSREERFFLSALKASPKDPVARAEYADWLEDEGRQESADMLREDGAWTPLISWMEEPVTIAHAPPITEEEVTRLRDEMEANRSGR